MESYLILESTIFWMARRQARSRAIAVGRCRSDCSNGRHNAFRRSVCYFAIRWQLLRDWVQPRFIRKAQHCRPNSDLHSVVVPHRFSCSVEMAVMRSVLVRHGGVCNCRFVSAGRICGAGFGASRRLFTGRFQQRHENAAKPVGAKTDAVVRATMSVIITLGLVIFFRSWIHSTVSTYIPQVYKAQGFSNAEAGNVLFSILLPLAIGGLIGGTLSDELGDAWC